MLTSEVQTMQFYVLREVVGAPHETEFEKDAPVIRGEPAMCPVCKEGFISMKPWLPPRRALIRVWGKELGDVAFGPGNELLVSEYFRLAWIEHGLRGLDVFEPVEVVRLTPARLARAAPSFHCILPKLGTTSLDFSRSTIERSGEPDCLFCGKGSVKNAIHGVVIAEETWGGEDIFRPLGLVGSVIVTSRFREMVAAKSLKNFGLVPVERYTWPPKDDRAS